MPVPKLHLNEHLSWHLAEQLRKLGFDVTSTIESGMLEDDDQAQLAFAISQQRAIVSINHKHFTPLHEQYLAEGNAIPASATSDSSPLKIRRVFVYPLA